MDVLLFKQNEAYCDGGLFVMLGDGVLWRRCSVDHVTQLFSDLKEGDFLWGDENGFAGLRVSPFFHPACAKFKTSKASYFNFVSSRERVSHRIKNSIDHNLHLALCQ